jgi:hypothetical protein
MKSNFFINTILIYGGESVIGWNLDLLETSTFLDTDYLRMATIEGCTEYRYPQESPKTPTYFWTTTLIRGYG